MRVARTDRSAHLTSRKDISMCLTHKAGESAIIMTDLLSPALSGRILPQRCCASPRTSHLSCTCASPRRARTWMAKPGLRGYPSCQIASLAAFFPYPCPFPAQDLRLGLSPMTELESWGRQPFVLLVIVVISARHASSHGEDQSWREPSDGPRHALSQPAQPHRSKGKGGKTEQRLSHLRRTG